MGTKNSLEARVSQHDKEIGAIRKLVLTGMKMLVRIEEQIRLLTASQRQTDRLMQAFLKRRKPTTPGSHSQAERA